MNQDRVSKKSFLLLLPSFIWLGLLMLLPLTIIVFFSFGARDALGQFRPDFTLSNYRRFFDGPYMNCLWRSFNLSCSTTFFCLLLGFPVSAWLAFQLPKKQQAFFMVLLTIPLSISFLLRIYAWITILRPTGLLAGFMREVGWVNPPLLLYNDGAVLLGMVYNYLPYMILPIYAALEKLDRRYIEAAYDLGAGPRQTFFRVTVPLSMKGIVAGVIMVFVPSLGDYVTPDLIGGAKHMYIGSLIQNQYLAVRDWAFGSAVSTILLVIVGFGVWVYMRYGEKPAVN